MSSTERSSGLNQSAKALLRADESWSRNMKSKSWRRHLLAGEQALLLHGLTEEQIAEIRRSQQLVQALTIRAPSHSHVGNKCAEDHLFHLQRLSVSEGQQVEAGQELAILADHCELLIEGAHLKTTRRPYAMRSEKVGKSLLGFSSAMVKQRRLKD